MKYLIFSIYDRVASQYGDLMLFANVNLAIRKFDYLMKNAPMVSCDCDLYQFGSYDTETGSFIIFDKPEFVRRFSVGDINE